MNNQKGQVILILILVMIVALAIGLSVIQRSLSDVSTATKLEQSSRAFSAAEAGIENKLSGGTGTINFADNGSIAEVLGGDKIPCVPGSTDCLQGSVVRQAPFEYSLLAKEEVIHVWFANYALTSNPPPAVYTKDTLDVYWGNSATDQAALELTLVYYDGTKYKSRKWYLDQTARTPANNFDTNASCGGFTIGSNIYQCMYTIGGTNSGIADPDGLLPSGLMLLRARLLYNATSQPFAVQAVGNCGLDCSIPPQARTLIATGTAGATQRKIKLFQIDKVVPPFFDYAIFSAGEINKE
ncbi:pilus assembly PilX N-terminal domain-containing protein [Candidatus Daviesbacteria bacterium]|nr:pilus assembly PilX N-terminal domain-containing protein [Candidatus Daviesbacteria bacterium]